MAIYGPWLEKVFDDYLAGKTIKAMLVTSTYAQNVDHDFRDDITASEVSGAGYTAGGVAVTNFVASYDATGDFVKITCDPVSFAVQADSIGGIVFYVSAGSAATDRIIVADLFGPVDADGTTGLVYNPNTVGIAVAQIGADA